MLVTVVSGGVRLGQFHHLIPGGAESVQDGLTGMAAYIRTSAKELVVRLGDDLGCVHLFSLIFDRPLLN
jgi:hypothetical protein